MLHHIAYDEDGKVELPEFLRLAGLVAADAADVHDLVTEFCRHEVTLNLEAHELNNPDAYTWYSLAFDGYQSWQLSLEAKGRDTVERLQEAAVESYVKLFEEAAHTLKVLAAEANVGVKLLAPVVPLHGSREWQVE